MKASEAIQANVNTLKRRLETSKHDDGVTEADEAQLVIWRADLASKLDELEKALSAEEAQKTIEQHVEEEVNNNGYALDTMVVDGLTAPEIITDDSQYKLIRKGVQVIIVGMNISHSTALKKLTDELYGTRESVKAEVLRADQMLDDNKDLEVANYQLGLENDDLKEKVRKGAEQNNEMLQQIEQKNQHIADLQNQIAIGVRGALNVVDIPQDTSKFAAEIIARKVRITNDRFKDENGIDRRIKIAENVLTGEKVEYEAIYEKRFIILDAMQAEQYRADEANRLAEKAELEQKENAIPPSIEPLDEPQQEAVEELVEDAETQPKDEVQAIDSQGDSADLRDAALEPLVVEESEVNKPFITRGEYSRRLADFRYELLHELEMQYGLVRIEVA